MDRSGGLITPKLVSKAVFVKELGCNTTEHGGGGITADALGRSTVSGLYVAGDAAYLGPSQLFYAAASGSKVAVAVLMDLTEEDFSWVGILLVRGGKQNCVPN